MDLLDCDVALSSLKQGVRIPEELDEVQHFVGFSLIPSFLGDYVYGSASGRNSVLCFWWVSAERFGFPIFVFFFQEFLNSQIQICEGLLLV